MNSNLYTVSALQPMVAKGARYRGLLLGLLLYIIFEYIRFGNWIPAIEDLHLQRIIAIATLIGFVLSFKDKIYHPKILLSLLVIIVFSTFANYGNLSRARALLFFTSMAKITAIYYLISNLLIERDNLKKFIWVFLISNFILVFTGFMAGGYKGALSGGVFAGGFVSDSNDYALAVNVILPFFWYLFIYEKRSMRKAIYGFSSLICLIAVIYSFSRGGFIGLSAAVIYMLITSKKKILNIIIFLVLLGICFVLAPPEYWERMRSITGYQNEDIRSSSQIRARLWKIGVNMAIKNPIFGVGPLNFPYQIVEYGADVEPNLNELHYLGGRAAHNTFIQVAAELGLPGLFCFMALIIIAYKNANSVQRKFTSIQRREDYWLQALPLAIKAALVAYCVSSFFLTTSVYPHVYILSALSFAIRRTEF